MVPRCAGVVLGCVSTMTQKENSVSTVLDGGFVPFEEGDRGRNAAAVDAPGDDRRTPTKAYGAMLTGAGRITKSLTQRRSVSSCRRLDTRERGAVLHMTYGLSYLV